MEGSQKIANQHQFETYLQRLPYSLLSNPTEVYLQVNPKTTEELSDEDPAAVQEESKYVQPVSHFA